MVCRLIEKGHGNRVLDYGYSYFLTALVASHEISWTDQKKLAMAVRYSRLDEKDWKRFLRS